MDNLNLPLSPTILGMNYLGDVVFAISGALTAGRHKMDIVGYVLIGTITGIGGGTLRDLLLGREVWWISNPDELILCVVASIIAFFFISLEKNNNRTIVWLDAVGLGAFAVVGTHAGLICGASFVVAVFMGMVTATGGGVLRDVLTNTKPMILSAGQLYATVALGGSFVYALIIILQGHELLGQALGFLTALALRTASIVFGIGTGLSGTKAMPRLQSHSMFKGDAMIVRKQLYFSCLAAFIGLASSFALAQQKHSHVHEHGKGNLEITLDKNRIISRFTSPLQALVGFERLPKSQTENDAVVDLNQRLQNPAALFSTNAEAECKPTIVENKIVRDTANKHADLLYQVEFTCTKPAALKQMTILIFKYTKYLKEVRVEFVGPSGQKSSTASAKSSTVPLK